MRNRIKMIRNRLTDEQIASIYEEYIATLTGSPLPLFEALINKICIECEAENDRTNSFGHMVFEMIKDDICRRFCNAIFEEQYQMYLGNKT